MSYEYWEKALADPKALRAREFRITMEPQPGFFRTYKLNEPVAIWRDGETGQLVIQVNGYEIDPSEHETAWLNVAKNPVSEEAFQKALDGDGWDDIDEAVAVIGDNRRKGDDAALIIDDLAIQAAKYTEITDDEMAKRAISLRAALQEQGKKVDKARESEKAPWLKEAKAVDEVYMPSVKMAKTWADYLRHLVEAFETRKRREAREADLLSQPIEAEPVDQIRTGYGRAASVRERVVVTGIADLHILVAYLDGTQHDALAACLIELAQKDVNNGRTVAGAITSMQAIIR